MSIGHDDSVLLPPLDETPSKPLPDDEQQGEASGPSRKKGRLGTGARIALTVLLVVAFPVCAMMFAFSQFMVSGIAFYFFVGACIALFVLIWGHDRKPILIAGLVLLLVCAAGLPASYAYETRHVIDQSSTDTPVKVNENIDYMAYLPFTSQSIARLGEGSTLQFSATDALPRVDSASALLPLASAFVTATYPQGVTSIMQVDGGKGSDGKAYRADTSDPATCIFQYNNTVGGYYVLARGSTDIFFGAKPSAEQVAYASGHGVEFEYTPIGQEAFVFFVNADNPVDSLTAAQVRGIYSGRIKNWSEVGGRDAAIIAYQRNSGSGSQSQMERFMGDVPLMDAPESGRSNTMSGIVVSIANYDNGIDAIGYSFRYYATDLVGDYKIKLLAIDDVEPTVEQIAAGSYPITGDFYAVTRVGEQNPNVARLLSWICSDQGQSLVEQSGYTRLAAK